MGHVFLMLPMGYAFIFIVFAEAKRFGAFLTWKGTQTDAKRTFYQRAAFFFIIGVMAFMAAFFFTAFPAFIALAMAVGEV